jgi:hypothetical protein
MSYAGRVNNGVVVEAIVGTAEWAIQNLGGEWHDSETKIRVPGLWDDANGFQPMPAPEQADEPSTGMSEPPPAPEPVDG